MRRLREVDDTGLTDDQRIDRDLALMVLRGRELQTRLGRLATDARRLRRPPPSPGSSASCRHRLRPEPELAEAVAARLRATPALLAHCRDNLDPTMADPVLLRRLLGEIGAGVAYSRSVSAEFGGDRTAQALRRRRR